MDRRVRARVEGVARTALLPALVEAMAPLDADLVEADWAAIVAAPCCAGPAGAALVVLLTPLGLGRARGGPAARAPAAHRPPPGASSPRSPTRRSRALARGRGDAYAVYGAAAAERAVLERVAVAAELGRLGVDVVDGAPERPAAPARRPLPRAEGRRPALTRP